MNIEALCHIPKSNYAYAYKEDELHIRIRTAKGDMEQVSIIFGNKYDWYNRKQKHPMRKIHTDLYYDYYQYEIKKEDFRIGYYFELNDGSQILYYTEAGMVTKFNDELAYCYFFQYPYLNPIDVHKQPSWIGDAVFYQIFVERFQNGNIENSPPYICSWDDDPKPKSFFGGDLQGIIDKLDYLHDLGINGIYLTPVFTSPSNHKYDTVNYYEIDPYFGDEKVFHELVDKAHEKGIKIILDAVFNHCSNHFPPFVDVTEKGKDSQYYDWFSIDGDTVKTDPPNYKMFGYVGYMPKLNTSNPKLKEYLFSSIRYWTEQFNIDGWRLDVSDEIDHRFWREFRTLVKEIKEDAIIIGENWHDALPWLMGDQFDSVMNYPVTKQCLDYFARNEIGPKEFEGKLSTYLMRYPDQVNEAMLNLLDSHDTERFLYTAGERKEALRNAATFLFAYKGMPCTYYGSEIGMTGNHDPGCRKGFDWREENWDMEFYRLYKKLIRIRKTEKALQYGNVEFGSTDDLFVMKRSYEKESILVVINNTASEQEYGVVTGESKTVMELLGDEVWDIKEGSITVKIPAGSARYYKLS
ncbi:MAG TPA: glycoside hydrolase family 13 protein [Mobilitalea sp.]|nr:glycoside hydrolase family 13 protein [Mobilitalea sp.]